MPSKIDHVHSGDPITAELFNALLDRVNWINNFTADGGLELYKHPGGLHLRGIVGAAHLKLYRAAEDINRWSSGTCHPATVSGGTFSEDTGTSITINNELLPTIWNDAYLFAMDVDRELQAVASSACTLLLGLANAAALTSGWNTITVSVGEDGDPPTTSTISAHNTWDLDGSQYSEVLCLWQEYSTDRRWRIIQAEGSAITVVTNVQMSGGVLQKKTRDVTVRKTSAESGWT